MKQLLTLLFIGIASLYAQTVPSYVPTNGLVGWWPFNGNANDESGNGLNSVQNTAQLINDRNGITNSAYQLGSGIIRLPQSTLTPTYTSSFSISLWFTHSASSNHRLISTECPEGNFRIANWGGNGVFAIQFGSFYIIDTLPSPSQWNHLVFTYNNRTSKVYINGTLVTTAQNTSNDNLNYCNPVCIGGKASSTSNDRWNGKVDDLAIWNRSLSVQEIQNLFSSSTNCSELFFSEYRDGSGLDNRIEVYNPSSDTINLNNYQIKLFSNGSNIPSASLQLPNFNLSPKNTYIISHPAYAGSSNITDAGLMSFDGNDALILLRGLDTLDKIGQIGSLPVSGWQVGVGTTAGYNLVRKFSVSSGQLNWPLASQEWYVYPLSSSFFGFHTSNCAQINTTPVSVISPSVVACTGKNARIRLQVPENSLNMTNQFQFFLHPGTPSSFTISNSVQLSISQLQHRLPLPISTDTNSFGIKWIDVSIPTNITVPSIYSIGIKSTSPSKFIDTIQVVINISPPASINYIHNISNTINNNPSFCNNDTVTLYANSGHSDYQWYRDSVRMLGETSGSLMVMDSGTYKVEVRNGGCNSFSKDTTLIRYIVPSSISISKLTFCASDSSVITAAGGQSYLWNTGDTTQSITVNQTGNYAATVTTVNSCVGVTDTVSTTVVPDVVLPQILGDLYGWFASGDTVNFSVVNTGGYTLTWGVAGGQITGGQGGDTVQVVWGAADSTAAIWVVVSNGVCQDSAYLNLVISGLGTGEGIGSKAMAYPNPNSGVFTLEWINMQAHQVVIYNGVGQVVATQAVDSSSSTLQVDLSTKAAGIYRAVIYGKDDQVTLPVYVRH